jgi:thioredoxin-related protein
LKAKNNLESNILSRNASVHTLDNEKNNLDMLKEDAMIYSLKIESEEEENSHNNDKKENISMDTKEGNTDE